jgi:hypothetical protein
MKIKSKLGVVSYNNFGSKMTIIEYKDNANIIIEFEDGYIVKNNYCNFKNGTVKNPYEKRTCNIGYLGEGQYTSRINGKKTKHYTTWRNMLKRCYDEKDLKKDPCYIGCSVCGEWHNFQNFAKWFDDNYYEINNYKMELDKDILIKGNKIYSPKTCVFVPRIINTLFTKSNKMRGVTPIGVTIDNQCVYKKYKGYCSNLGNKPFYLGHFLTLESAFIAYKLQKEKTIKQVAEKFKNDIPDSLYKALIKYKVEITD